MFDEPKDEEITEEEVPETKKDLFEDGDDDEGKFIFFFKIFILKIFMFQYNAQKRNKILISKSNGFTR